MKIRSLIILIIVSIASMSFADTIRLKNGNVINGKIVFQNEEVVVIQNNDGARFQYPHSEVVSISENDVDTQPIEQEKRQVVRSSKRFGMSLQAVGGGGWIPKQYAGGNVSVDWFLGACNIQQKHIFVGGGVGYHAFFCGGETYNFIPLQFRFSAPLMQTRHAPMLGATIGYGFSPKKSYKGGICGSVDAGWRMQTTERTALFVGLNATIQQGSANVSETINNVTYSELALSVFSSVGMKVAFDF